MKDTGASGRRPGVVPRLPLALGATSITLGGPGQGGAGRWRQERAPGVNQYTQVGPGLQAADLAATPRPERGAKLFSWERVASGQQARAQGRAASWLAVCVVHNCWRPTRWQHTHVPHPGSLVCNTLACVCAEQQGVEEGCGKLGARERRVATSLWHARKSVRPAVWRQLAGRGGGRTHKLRRAQR